MNQKNDAIKQPARESGIEAFKIAAVFLIVISHIVQTFEHILHIENATLNIQIILLQLFRAFGTWSNTIFFICSAWFLLDSDRYSKKKWIFMLVEIWSVSVIFIIITGLVRHGNISSELLIKSLFPTTFSTNWYLTCYLLFYPLHPLLNKWLRVIDQKTHLRVSLVMLILYFGFNFIKGGLFLTSNLILWICIYFMVGYFKKYMTAFCGNIRKNAAVCIVSAVLFIGLVVTGNILGQHIHALSDQMLHFATIHNPLMLACIFSLFNIIRSIRFKSKAVNYISGLSMLIYIIHDNLLVRSYFRPELAEQLYRQYGDQHLVLMVLIFSIVLFIVSVICAVLYRLTIERAVKRISHCLYTVSRRIYLSIEKKLLAKT